MEKARIELGYMVCEKSYICLKKPELSSPIIKELTLKNMKIISRKIPTNNVNLHKNPVLKSSLVEKYLFLNISINLFLLRRTARHV